MVDRSAQDIFSALDEFLRKPRTSENELYAHAAIRRAMANVASVMNTDGIFVPKILHLVFTLPSTFSVQDLVDADCPRQPTAETSVSVHHDHVVSEISEADYELLSALSQPNPSTMASFPFYSLYHLTLKQGRHIHRCLLCVRSKVECVGMIGQTCNLCRVKKAKCMYSKQSNIHYPFDAVVSKQSSAALPEESQRMTVSTGISGSQQHCNWVGSEPKADGQVWHKRKCPDFHHKVRRILPRLRYCR
jgi:hypothetical protein